MVLQSQKTAQMWVDCYQVIKTNCLNYLKTTFFQFYKQRKSFLTSIMPRTVYEEEGKFTAQNRVEMISQWIIYKHYTARLKLTAGFMQRRAALLQNGSVCKPETCVWQVSGLHRFVSDEADSFHSFLKENTTFSFVLTDAHFKLLLLCHVCKCTLLLLFLCDI